ncbi:MULTISPECIES: hypothetical protein [unclassified Sphingobium]|uniref:hypothetical protein n=1 Tax=unclassified Sphingobium TaxID=2611147 RepID=UPI0005CC8C14|nr:MULTISPECIES: hypothetical protein [unclassified Sphingobium]AJR22529.1 hypothetical protein TZ53_00735 [Sphingobium sp. YBL2]UXC89525.1 hypothetical protein EGM87_10585 [Sphingobium sp. RSMS]
MGRFTQNGVVYEELPDGNVRVVGYADGGRQSAPSVVAPNPSKVANSQVQQRGQDLDNQRNAGTLPFAAPQAVATLTRTTQEVEGYKPKREQDLRAQFDKVDAVSQYRSVVPIFMSGLKAVPDPKGDDALLYHYAKVMDPPSVVRDSERQGAADSASFWDARVAAIKKQMGYDGGGLAQSVRDGLIREMNTKMAELAKSYGVARRDYQRIAGDEGLRPLNVVGSFPFNDQQMRDYQEIIGRRGMSLRDQPYALPQSTLPPAERRQEVDPTGGDEFSTDQDRQYAAVAQAAFNNGANRQQMDAIAAAFGAPAFGDDLDRAIEGRARGLRTQLSIPASGRREPTLTGQLAAGPVGGAATGIMNGVTLGGLDEAIAAGRSAFTDIPYGTALYEANRNKHAIGRENPWSYNIGQIAGGLATAGAGGALGVGSKLPLLSDVGIGAIGGALEENDHRLGGAVLGGVLGGGIGAGLRGVSRLPGRPAPVDDTLSRVIDRAGYGGIRNRLVEARDLNIPMTLADADPALTALAGSATRFSPQAVKQASDVLFPRSLGQIDRFAQAVERDLGPLSNPMQQSDDLLAQARTAAAPLYERAYKAPVIGTPTLDSLINTPFGRQAVGKARTIAANERRDPAAMGFRLDADGNVVLEPTVPMTLTSAGREGGAPVQQPGYTTQTLDYAKRGMDDVLEQYRNPITGKLDLTTAGRAENGVRADFLTELDKLNPAYAQARAAYQGPMELRDALAAGRDAVKQSPREVQTIAGRSSPAQMEQMRLGYRVGLNDRANDMRYSSNPFEGILGTPAAEQRLSAVYGDNFPGVSRLLRQRDIERNLARSTNDILGNSKTAQRMIADETFGNSAAVNALDAISDIASMKVPVKSTIGFFGRAALKDRARLGSIRNAEKRANDLAPRLFSPDTAAIIDAVDTLMGQTARYRTRQNLLEPVVGQMGGAIGGMTPGWLFGH